MQTDLFALEIDRKYPQNKKYFIKYLVDNVPQAPIVATGG